MELDWTFGVLRNSHFEVSRVGGAGRNETHQEGAAGLPGVAFIDVIRLGVEQIGAIKMGAGIYRTLSVVGDFAAPENVLAGGIGAVRARCGRDAGGPSGGRASSG